MSIEDFKEKIKGLTHFKPISLPPLANDLFFGLILVLTAVGAFGLGRLSKIEGSKTPIHIENVLSFPTEIDSEQAQKASTQTSSILDAGTGVNTIIASKSGTKYYYSWCSGVKKIAVANRVYFSSSEEARAAGYTASNTCKGL